MWSGRLFSVQNPFQKGDAKMNEMRIKTVGGGHYIDSREVAACIGKDHNHLLRDIRGYSAIIEISNASKIGRIEFFLENAYVDSRGREKPCYLCSRSGCELIAHKLTGAKGVMFTAAYIRRFRELEQSEMERAIKAHKRPRLSEFNSAVRNVLDGMSHACVSPNRVMDFLCGVYEPLGIKVLTDGNDCGYYTATEIAGLLGMYSGAGRPHGHAVAAIIARLDIPQNAMAVVPYGAVGVSIKYSRDALNAVREWILANNYPSDVAYLDFCYHIYYFHPASEQLSLFDYDFDEDSEIPLDDDWDFDDDFFGEE
jgi:Rha family phage regulatory protein